MVSEVKGDNMSENSDRTNFEAPASSSPIVLEAPLEKKITPAGFWRRFVAALIDGVILVIAILPINAIGTYLGATESFTWMIYSNLVSALLSFLYQGYFLTSRNATIGKILLSIKVVRMNHEPIGFKTVVIREVVGKPLSGIILGIGYLMAAFREDKRALHDLLAETQVVEA